MALAREGNPNWELFTLVFQSGKVTWFRRLLTSTFRSILTRSLHRNVRDTDAFQAAVGTEAFVIRIGSGAETCSGDVAPRCTAKKKPLTGASVSLSRNPFPKNLQ